MRLRPLLLPLLALVVFAVFARVLGYGYVSYDDGIYAQGNEVVRAGLTVRGIGWAFSTFHGSTWLPVTWLSYMLDATFLGDGARGHHLTNVCLHALNAALLFRWLEQRTGAVWPALLAAALFALHPLRVESVAWVSGRKDVLSGTLFLCTLGAYARWVDSPSPRRYALVVAVYALGLAAKQTLITVPLLLLLLDVWPLGRGAVPVSRRLVEKLPLFALAAAGTAIGWLSQRSGVDARLAALPADARVLNALLAYGAYLAQTLSATGLSAHYPHPGAALSVGAALGVGALLLALTTLALALRRRVPAIPVGWLWFLGTLVPMLGLSAFGHDQARADRFTYLPHMGLFVALAYGAAGLARARPAARRFLTGFALVWLCWFGARAAQQCGVWRDTESLWTHALAVEPEDGTAHYNLGVYHAQERGDMERALAHLQAAARLMPDSPEALGNLGVTLATQRRFGAAEPLLRRAAELRPGDANAQLAHGSTLAELRRMPEAAAAFERAAQLRPDDLDLLVSTGQLLAGAGEKRAGAGYLLRVAAVRADDAQLVFDAGRMLADAGDWPAAIAALKAALERRPGWLEALTTLARVQDAAGRPKGSARSWAQVVEARPDDAALVREIEAALAGL
jgi:tetratricopeptide (TPR) repeat protein